VEIWETLMRLAIFAAVFAMPALAQEQVFPEPKSYYCSLDSVNEYDDGRSSWNPEAYEDERRPSLSTFPRQNDDNLVTEAMSEDGTVYAYVRILGEGIRQYAIHGTFDFSAQRLVTTRSAIFPTDDDSWVTSAASFVFLCSPVNADAQQSE
jgi:hypothetical protein